MKQNFTLKGFFLKKENWLVAAMFGLLFVFGCYEFRSVDQPTEGTKNSTFEVAIVVGEDDDDSNDFTDESGDLADTKGLFGVLLPEGWTISDSIEVRVESADSAQNADGLWVYPTVDHSGDYYLVYDEGQTTMLNDSTADPPDGYYWWGAKTSEPVDMAFLDSLHFIVSILTDDQMGTFYLQYAVGDEDADNRMPYDPEVITDPLPITISPGVGVNHILTESNLSLYPNPSYGFLNIDLGESGSTDVDMLIYDLRGKQVMSGTLSSAQTTLDLVDLDPGVYVLRLDTGEETLTRKFVRE
jgi:hypothetical protein